MGSIKQAVHYLNQDFQALKEECLQNEALFEDHHQDERGGAEKAESKRQRFWDMRSC